MTTKDEQLYGDIDDLLTFAGGYLIALKEHRERVIATPATNGVMLKRKTISDKLIKRTEQTIQKIGKRYRKQIDELYAPAEPHPEALTLKK